MVHVRHSRSLICTFTALCFMAAIFLGMRDASAATVPTITGYSIAQNFSCQGGSASGQLFSGGGSCPEEPSFDHIFSFYVCEFEKIVNEVFAKMYCGILGESQFPVMAALTLFIVLMGGFFTMGVIPFTAKDLMMTLFKFCFVYAFAMHAEYAVGYGYRFFMIAAKEGIALVLAHLSPDGAFHDGGDVYQRFDDLLNQILGGFAQGETNENKCKNAVIAMLALVAAAFPPLAFLAVYMMVRLLWCLFRAVCGYCLGILGIAFLMTVSPLFVSFAMFRFTRPLFDKYLQYLFSFSFQMVVVFAFIGMVMSMSFKSEFEETFSLVKPYKENLQTSGQVMPWKFCGICDVEMSGGKPKCKTEDAQQPGALAKNDGFLKFATKKVVFLLVLAYLIDVMMDLVPEMARILAGPRVMLRLGGGPQGVGAGTSMQVPGEQQLEQGMQKLSEHLSGTSLSQVKSGLSNLVTRR